MRINHPFRQRGGNAARKIEEQETNEPHCVFDVVSEGPEKEHVSGKVQKAAMEKHRGDDREPWPGNAVHGFGYNLIEQILRYEPVGAEEHLRNAWAERKLP